MFCRVSIWQWSFLSVDDLCLVQDFLLSAFILPYIHAPICAIALSCWVFVPRIGPCWLCKRVIEVTGLIATIDKSVQASLFRIDSLDFLYATFIEFMNCSLVFAVVWLFFIQLSVDIIYTEVCTIDCSNWLCINLSRLLFELSYPSILSL